MLLEIIIVLTIKAKIQKIIVQVHHFILYIKSLKFLTTSCNIIKE